MSQPEADNESNGVCILMDGDLLLNQPRFYVRRGEVSVG